MILCLDESRREFLTVDSLDKFHCKNSDRHHAGRKAVQSALEWDGIADWRDDETGERVAGAARVEQGSFGAEPYLPFIVLAQSPVFCQLLLPAEQIRIVLSKLLDMSNAYFANVRGKLPIHVGLLVANRRFPLYALIEIWDVLRTHLGTTQRHHLHEALATKLEEWKTVRQEVKPAFEAFGKVLIRDAFGKEWQKLSNEQRRCLQRSTVDGMSLEALELFQHVAKERS